MIEIRDGTLRVRGAGLDKPVLAEHAEIRVAIAPRPGPVTWSARLANGDPASPRDKLDVDGRLERETAPGNLDLRVKGQSWPWSIGGRRLAASGRLDGGFSARRSAGRWKLAGDAALVEVVAAGSRLAGDRLRLDRVNALWQIDETAAGWSIRQLELRSPIARLEAAGSLTPSDPLGGISRVDGTIDLSAIAAQLPHALRLRDGVALKRGTAAIRVETRDATGAPMLDISAKVSDLIASDRGRTFTLREPATLSARLKQTEGVVGVDWLSAETPYMTIRAQGEPTRGVALTGTLDLSGLKRQFGDLIDFGAVELSGRGALKGSYRAVAERFDLGLGVDMKDVRVEGFGSIEREDVGLNLELTGPAARSGFPRGWGRFHSRLDSGKGSVAAGLDAAPGPGGTDVTGFVSAPGPCRASRNGSTAGSFRDGTRAGRRSRRCTWRFTVRRTNPSS